MEKGEFKERFRKLYDDSGCKSITQFSKQLEMNRQSVDRYHNGERCPDAPALAQICEKMNVSSDWLLGLSDVKTPSADLRAASAFSHLPEEIIEMIQNYSPDVLNAFVHFISHSYFNQMIGQYAEYLKMIDQASEIFNSDLPGGNIGIGAQSSLTIEKDGTVKVSSIWEALYYVKQDLSNYVDMIVDNDRLSILTKGNNE